MPDLPDEPSDAAAAHAPTPAQAPEGVPVTPPVTPPVTAPSTAPVTAPVTPQADAPVVNGDPPTVDHFAALSAIVPEAQLDALAARVIASGGVQGVTFQPDDGGATAAHADLGSHASAIQSQLQASADKFVTDQGVNVADFHRYVKQQGPAVLNSTALVLFHSRSPDTALRALVTEYKRTANFRRSRS